MLKGFPELRQMLHLAGLGYKAESSGREEDNANQPDLHEGQILNCMQQKRLLIHVLKDFQEPRQI